MEAKLTREQANDLLHKYVKGENYITHSYAVEAIMRGHAKKIAQMTSEHTDLHPQRSSETKASEILSWKMP